MAGHLLEANDWTFSSSVQRNDIYVDGIDEYDGIDAYVTIEWGIDFDVRTYGIKDINIHVRHVAANVTYTDYDGNAHDASWEWDHTEKATANRHGFDFTGDDTEDYNALSAMLTEPWTVKVIRNTYASTGVYPTQIEIDYSSNTAKITF